MGEKYLSENNENYIRALVLHSAREANILPLTSACNVRCVFCSHRQNPPGVEAYRLRPRTLEQVEEMLSFMEPALPVVIGESVTRVLEGEPFTHPKIKDILTMIRTMLPSTPIQVTTNGTLLEEDMVKFLSNIDNLTLYLSLNSANVNNRTRLMNDQLADRAVAAPGLLSRYEIDYHGSLVAMPHIIGWTDLEFSIKLLADKGAATIRIFLPGFTKLAPEECKFDPSLRERLARFVADMRREVDVPLTLEPPYLNDLFADVIGVIKDTPASMVGISPGDMIVSVEGTRPFSRFHAFQMVKKLRSPRLVLQRGGRELTVQMHKAAGEKSGLVMDFDLAPETIEDVYRAARRRRAANVLVLSSELAAPILEMGLAQRANESCDVEVLPVKSNFYGGSIMSAGLLVVSDYVRALQGLLTHRPGKKPDLALVPYISFDPSGRDLTGVSYSEIARCTGVDVEVV